MKNLNLNELEILSPAGNPECFYANINNGADAVYLAGNNFGARSYADNFNNEEMEEAVDFCHLRGKAVYVTVNTLVSDREIEELLGYLGFLYEIGVDGVIVPMDNSLCARAIADVLSSEEKMRELSENCRSRDYSSIREIDKIYGILEI